ncbi:hypothetical protein Sta7437_1942 [Stanieria cyanosphaera PCC 7437]|uniref:Uncharacterized protein n=1 Tax=Stanieria cyanosphaera (strain ATCC 29371 / PCC 7437) TaxID=111780 RepID=K9XTU3_STAC7|nr:hypothetical protein [Stanieria cyanosphaera]AFZ35496.1 hypothetical protein Sta7437_1942 [Stanieria cyanosphaera PCC 7437]
MLALSLVSLGIATGAIYISYKIQDDVFKVAMNSTALLFFVITLICSPWLLKMIVATIPLIFIRLNPWFMEKMN